MNIHETQTQITAKIDVYATGKIKEGRWSLPKQDDRMPI